MIIFYCLNNIFTHFEKLTINLLTINNKYDNGGRLWKENIF